MYQDNSYKKRTPYLIRETPSFDARSNLASNDSNYTLQN